MSKEVASALTEIEFKKVRFPIKHIIETYLRHADSGDQNISDEISLKFTDPSPEEEERMNNPRKEEQLLSKLLIARQCPKSFIIHETFPILLIQDGTHFASIALDKKLFENIKE